MRDYKPNLRIVERLADLWCNMIRKSKFDNGDKSPAGAFGSMLAHMVPSNVDDENLAKFKQELVRSLTTPKEPGWYVTSLHTDYGPDGVLSDAAEAAGLECEFPWKTNSWIHSTYCSVSAGYGAEAVYHYPLEDGRWLVTTLSGSEITKVVEYVNGGKPEFMVE